MQVKCSGKAESLKQQLHQMQITSVNWVIVTAPGRTDEPNLLATNLSVVQSLPCAASLIYLHGWEASCTDIHALSKLPSWRGELHLHLRTCGAAARLAYAPRHIPQSYRTWVVDQRRLTPQECQAFIEAAPRNRTAERPLTIKVIGGDVSWVEGVADRMAQEGKYPHVTVVAG